MTTWLADDLAKIAATDDLHIAPFRSDGTTYGTPTWIWSVAVDSTLYVRAYNGTRSRWYQSAKSQQAGRITAAGKAFDVTFEVIEEPSDALIHHDIDAAYRLKYASSPHVGHMVSNPAKAATVRVTPRNDA